MTLAAGLFSYCTTTRGNVNVVFKPTGGEVVGMPETVARFRRVLANQSGGVWQSLQTATARWLDFSQPLNWSCMT